MTLEQLEFILEVERVGTIVAAAQNLNISHTTISRAISNLEDELGFVIFLRSRRGSTLTEKGREAVRLAQSIVAQADQLRQLGRRQEKGILKIGAYPVESIRFLQEAILRFNAMYPDITIFIDRSNVGSILSLIAAHDIDLGLMFHLPELLENISPDVDIVDITESPLLLVCSPASRLAKRDRVTPEDLRSESFVLQQEAQITYMMKRMFTPDGMPNVTMYTNDNELIKSTIRANNAVATYTELFIANDPLVRSGELVCVPIWVDGQPYKLRYIYARPAKKPVSPAERMLIKLIRQAVS